MVASTRTAHSPVAVGLGDAVAVELAVAEAAGVSVTPGLGLGRAVVVQDAMRSEITTDRASIFTSSP
jgi:hypothetical protein